MLRNPALLVLIPAIVVLFAAGALASRDDSGVFIFVVGAVVAVLAARPSVTLTPEGLTVSNFLPRRYRWDELTNVDMEYRMYYPILTLRLKDGGKKRVWAVAVGRGGYGRGWAEQTGSRIRARWERETDTPPSRSMFY